MNMMKSCYFFVLFYFTYLPDFQQFLMPGSIQKLSVFSTLVSMKIGLHTWRNRIVGSTKPDIGFTITKSTFSQYITRLLSRNGYILNT